MTENINNNPITKKTVISSLIWKFLERGGVQGVQFILTIVLARLVTPSDYGIISILLVFIQIANVFIQTGFNTALIQKKESDDTDFSTIFYLSLFVALIIYMILFFSAPLVSIFFNNQQYTPLLRVISITLFFGAINSIQSAFVSKKMMFRKFFFSSMGAVIGSGIVGIVMAYKGFGVWALVGQQLSKDLLTCIILWFTVEWRPRNLFSWKSIKELFGFGWKLLCSGILDTFFRNIYNIVIGKIYSSDKLGFFNRGQQFPQVIAINLEGAIQSVLLPALSSHNDRMDEVKNITRRAVSISSYVLMPCMFLLAAVAKPLVIILLTDKWLPCVPFFQISCITYAFWPICNSKLTSLNAIGKSDEYLKLTIIRIVFSIVVLIASIPFGIIALAFGQILVSFFTVLITLYPCKKYFNYSYKEQIKDVLSSFLVSCVIGILVFLINYISINNYLKIIIQCIVGIVLYLGCSICFKIDSFYYIKNLLIKNKKE